MSTSKTSKTATVTITATRADGSTESITASPSTGKPLTRASAVKACDAIAKGAPDEGNPIVRLNVSQGAKALHVVSLGEAKPAKSEKSEELPEDFKAFEEARKAAKTAKAEAKASAKKGKGKPRSKANFDPANVPASITDKLPSRSGAIPKGARAAAIVILRNAKEIGKDGKVAAIPAERYAELMARLRTDFPKVCSDHIAWTAAAINAGAYPVRFETEAKKRDAAAKKADKKKAASKATKAKAAAKKAEAKPAKAKKAKKAATKASKKAAKAA